MAGTDGIQEGHGVLEVKKTSHICFLLVRREKGSLWYSLQFEIIWLIGFKFELNLGKVVQISDI